MISKELIQKRKDFLGDFYDKVLDEYHDARFSEWTVRIAGDVCVFRVYGNTPETMTITER